MLSACMVAIVVVADMVFWVCLLEWQAGIRRIVVIMPKSGKECVLFMAI